MEDIKTGFDTLAGVDNPTGSGILTRKKELPGVFVTGVRKPAGITKKKAFNWFMWITIAFFAAALGLLGTRAKKITNI